MPYGECKIYSDGSHYIAIPHTTKEYRERPKKMEDTITVVCETETKMSSVPEQSDTLVPIAVNEEIADTNAETTEDLTNLASNSVKYTRKLTRKEYFEELYMKYLSEKKSVRKEKITEEMLPYFTSEERAKEYVEMQFDRKERNLICRRVRLARKVNLQEFNYFCTFTYDNEKHTEESFKKKLRTSFRHLVERRGWKYVGVWERSPEKQRLHFHGLFYVPEGNMVGEIERVQDYSPIKKLVQTTFQNTYFNRRFGRSDFRKIEDKTDIGEAVAYLTKYIEKTGEKIVYSKGLPQYFISDIMDEDIACPIGIEDKKLLLFDDFTCWDEGTYMGMVSKEVIKQLRTAN